MKSININSINQYKKEQIILEHNDYEKQVMNTENMFTVKC